MPHGRHASAQTQLKVAFLAPGNMKTFSAKAQEVQRDWYVVDGTAPVLCRLAAVDLIIVDRYSSRILERK